MVDAEAAATAAAAAAAADAEKDEHESKSWVDGSLSLLAEYLLEIVGVSEDVQTKQEESASPSIASSLSSSQNKETPEVRLIFYHLDEIIHLWYVVHRRGGDTE